MIDGQIKGLKIDKQIERLSYKLVERVEHR